VLLGSAERNCIVVKPRPQHLSVLAIAVALSPILLAFLLSFFMEGGMWSEGSGSGTALWLLFFTVPISVLLLFISLLWWLIRRVKRNR